MFNLQKTPKQYLKMWNELTIEERKEKVRRGEIETPDKYALLWLTKILRHTPSQEEYENFYRNCSKEDRKMYLPPEYYEGLISILF